VAEPAALPPQGGAVSGALLYAFPFDPGLGFPVLGALSRAVAERAEVTFLTTNAIAAVQAVVDAEHTR
jgi:hypothetical protein